MNEEFDNPTVSEVVQSTSMESLNDEIALQTAEAQKYKKDSLKTKAFRSLGYEKKSVITEMQSEIKKKEEENESLKIAHLTSEAEKKDLIIENLKIAHAKAELEWNSAMILKECENKALITKMECESENKALITKMEYEAKLKANEAECQKKLEVEWKSRISQLEEAVKLAKIGENFENAEKTIHWTMSYSEIKSIPTYVQPAVNFAGTIWHLSVAERGYDFRFILTAEKDAFAWICPVAIEFQLLSSASKEVLYRRSSEYTFNSLNAKSVYIATVPDLEEIIERNRFGGKNDSINVAVALKILPTN